MHAADRWPGPDGSSMMRRNILFVMSFAVLIPICFMVLFWLSDRLLN
jgi:hypothetical protein